MSVYSTFRYIIVYDPQPSDTLEWVSILLKKKTVRYLTSSSFSLSFRHFRTEKVSI